VRSLRFLVHVGTVTFATALSTSPARADAMSDAKDLFARGRELRGQADCASAVALFRKAYETYPAALGSLRNLAECEESLGRFASARRSWLDLGRAALTNDDHKYAGWKHDADDAAARLLPKLSTLIVNATALSSRGETLGSEGLVVTLNGERLAPSVVGTALERDPGRYVIRVDGIGVTNPQERTIDLAAGEAKEVALRIAVTPEPESPAAVAPGPVGIVAEGAAAETHVDAKRADGSRRAMGWVAIGAGAVGAIGLGASVVVRRVALDDVEKGCRPTNGPGAWICPASMQSTVDRGNTASVMANVFAVVGGVGLVGGIVLLVTNKTLAPNTALVLSPGSVSAVGRF
jgi:hypothetical protein